MPTTTNLALPYPAASDNPSAAVLTALAQAADAYAGSWVSWTPVVTQSTTPTIQIFYAEYRIMTKSLTFAFKIKLTAAGTAGQPVLITLPPFAPKFTTVDMPRGSGTLSNRTQNVMLVSPAANTTQVRLQNSGGNYTTVLANTDFIFGWGKYEVA